MRGMAGTGGYTLQEGRICPSPCDQALEGGLVHLKAYLPRHLPFVTHKLAEKSHPLTSLPGSPGKPLWPMGPWGPGAPRSPGIPLVPGLPSSPWTKRERIPLQIRLFGDISVFCILLTMQGFWRRPNEQCGVAGCEYTKQEINKR